MGPCKSENTVNKFIPNKKITFSKKSFLYLKKEKFLSLKLNLFLTNWIQMLESFTLQIQIDKTISHKIMKIILSKK
jgi:hypothetical protein